MRMEDDGRFGFTVLERLSFPRVGATVFRNAFPQHGGRFFAGGLMCLPPAPLRGYFRLCGGTFIFGLSL